MEGLDPRYLLWRGVWGQNASTEGCGDRMSPLHVCVPLSTISFCPQDDCEDIEGNDEKEEAEEEEGRSNGFQSSMRIPLAVITHGQGCVSVMLCLYGREGSVQFCGGILPPHPPPMESVDRSPLLGKGVWGSINEPCECPHSA
jgi:hypothetical protein